MIHPLANRSSDWLAAILNIFNLTKNSCIHEQKKVFFCYNRYVKKEKRCKDPKISQGKDESIDHIDDYNNYECCFPLKAKEIKSPRRILCRKSFCVQQDPQDGDGV